MDMADTIVQERKERWRQHIGKEVENRQTSEKTTFAV